MEEQLLTIKEKLDRLIILLEQLIKLQGGVPGTKPITERQPVKVPEPKPRVTPADEDIGALLEAIDDTNLDDASFEFVKKMRGKHAQYKDKLFVTEKQMAWLRKLAGEEF